MVKMIVLGIVVVLTTLGGTHAGQLFTLNSTVSADTKEIETVEFIKIDATSVPVIREGAISGYVVVRAAFSASMKDVKQSRPLMTTFVAEALFKSVYAEEGLNFSAMKPVQIDALAEGVVTAANVRIGRNMVRQLAIESLNFLSLEDVRCQQKR